MGGSQLPDDNTEADVFAQDVPRAAGSPAPDADAPVRIWLLDGFRVQVGERTVEPAAWRTRKAAALAKLLALSPGRRIHPDQAIEWLWPESAPRAASANLRHAVHLVRRALDGAAALGPVRLPAVEQRGDVIRFAPADAVWVDVDAFDAAAAVARAGRHAADYEAALALYRGDLLPDEESADWTLRRREALRQTALQLVLELGDLHEGAGDRAAAVAVLNRAVAQEPTLEEAHVRLMRLLAASGRRDAALRQYRDLADALRRDLDVTPQPATERLLAAIRAGEPPAPAEPSLLRVVHPAVPPARTPPFGPLTAPPAPATSFVGRAGELAEIDELLAVSRLVSLVGTGGAGKTRLAIAVASAAGSAARYPAGVAFVDLAPVAADRVVDRVAAAFGVRAGGAPPTAAELARVVGDRRLLCILDNCEHALAACRDLVGALMRACPALRLLATSREPLGVLGEAVYRVAPLALPPANPSRLPPNQRAERVAAADSARLFLERARAQSPNFLITGETAAAVARVCRRLDGLPLAIELAAARLASMPLNELVRGLDDRLRLLVDGPRALPARHQTLRAAIQWSYDLLDPRERRLFERLSVFAGGWTAEAAESVGADRPAAMGTDPTAAPNGRDGGAILLAAEVPGVLARLVNRSVVAVQPLPDGRTRYRLLETVHQFAREQVDPVDWVELERRHAAYFLTLAERARAEDTGAAYAALEAERQNLRAALSRGLADGRSDTEPALRLAAALWRFWEVRGSTEEGQGWLVAALSRSPGAPAGLRAAALSALGNLARSHGDYARATEALRECLDLYRQLGDRRGAAVALNNAGNVARDLGDDAAARDCFVEALAIFRELGDSKTAARVLLNLGRATRNAGDPAAAGWLTESLVAFRDLGDSQGAAAALNGLGQAACDVGDLDTAVSHHTASLDLHRTVGDRWGVALSLYHLARARFRRGELDSARDLVVEALGLFRDLVIPRDIAASFELLAELAVARGDVPRAARLIGAARALRLASGARVPHADAPALAALEARVRALIGSAGAVDEGEAGAAMPLPAAIAYALGADAALSGG